MNYNTILPPFKWFVLQNFPYIEDDFDALTNWQLFCKLGNEMNKIIEKTNLTGEQVENLTNAYNELKAYIDNYFENLDVQDEIDNKLDEMAEQGVLTDIIAQYLQLAGVLAYNTKQAMKSATNLTEGSITKTLGNLVYNDGQGAFYKVRQVQNTDVIDDENIIALSDPDLVAEKIPYSSGYDITTQLNTLSTKVNTIDSNVLTEMIVIGDSFTFPDNSWCHEVARQLNLNLHNQAVNGAGFITESYGLTFKTALNNVPLADRNKTKYLIVYGGINDGALVDPETTDTDLEEAAVIDFCNTAKTLCPKATIIIAGPNWKNVGNFDISRTKLAKGISKGALKSGCAYVDPSSWLFNTEIQTSLLYQNDGVHPSELGQKILASKFMSLLTNSLEAGMIPKITMNSNLTYANTYVKKTYEGYRIELVATGTFNNGTFFTLATFDDADMAQVATSSTYGAVYLVDENYGYAEKYIGCMYIDTVGGHRVIRFVNTSGANITNRQIRGVLEVNKNIGTRYQLS